MIDPVIIPSIMPSGLTLNSLSITLPIRRSPIVGTNILQVVSPIVVTIDITGDRDGTVVSSDLCTLLITFILYQEIGALPICHDETEPHKFREFCQSRHLTAPKELLRPAKMPRKPSKISQYIDLMYSSIRISLQKTIYGDSRANHTEIILNKQ
jgi:hypothetical protein